MNTVDNPPNNTCMFHVPHAEVNPHMVNRVINLAHEIHHNESINITKRKAPSVFVTMSQSILALFLTSTLKFQINVFDLGIKVTNFVRYRLFELPIIGFRKMLDPLITHPVHWGVILSQICPSRAKDSQAVNIYLLDSYWSTIRDKCIKTNQLFCVSVIFTTWEFLTQARYNDWSQIPVERLKYH